MKTIKSILIATTLICASVVSTLSAQQAAQPAPKHEFKLVVGDTVMIKRECQRYCTGEEPSNWVWDKILTVRQLGTKKFANGVLLMNIYSWMPEECLIPVNGHAKEAAARAAAEQREERMAFEARKGIKSEPAKPAAQEAAPVKAAAPVATNAQAVKAEPVNPAAIQEAEEAAKRVEEAAKRAEEAAKRAEEAAKRVEAAALRAEKTVNALAAGEVGPFQSTESIAEADTVRYDYDRFTIGVRGGASALLHRVKTGNWTCGGDALLDLQYAHYWTKEGRPVDLGIITGLGIGYSQSGMKASVNTFNQVTDGEGMRIDYTVKTDEVKETDRQIQLEIPIMFSLIHTNGLFFNAGIRCMLPVFTPFDQKISDDENTYIYAYFPDFGVGVTNYEFTGKLAETQYKTSGTDNGNQFAFNLMLGAEIGYEWKLKSGNSLGLGAYANYCVFSTFKNDNTSRQPLVQVTAPDGVSAAKVEVLSATKTYAEKLGYFDVGIKLAYHFNFPRKPKANPAE
jgi:hypothetical protein